MDVFEENFQISSVLISGSIYKSPLENIAKIDPNIYNLDVGVYFDLFFYKYPYPIAIDSRFHGSQLQPITKSIHHDLADK